MSGGLGERADYPARIYLFNDVGGLDSFSGCL